MQIPHDSRSWGCIWAKYLAPVGHSAAGPLTREPCPRVRERPAGPPHSEGSPGARPSGPSSRGEIPCAPCLRGQGLLSVCRGARSRPASKRGKAKRTRPPDSRFRRPLLVRVGGFWGRKRGRATRKGVGEEGARPSRGDGLRRKTVRDPLLLLQEFSGAGHPAPPSRAVHPAPRPPHIPPLHQIGLTPPRLPRHPTAGDRCSREESKANPHAAPAGDSLARDPYRIRWRRVDSSRCGARGPSSAPGPATRPPPRALSSRGHAAPPAPAFAAR